MDSSSAPSAWRRTLRRSLASVVIVMLGAGLFVAVNQQLRSPERTAMAYLQALADADVEAATALTASEHVPDGAALLTDPALAAATTRIVPIDAIVDDTSTEPGPDGTPVGVAELTVTYALGVVPYSTTMRLRADGAPFGLGGWQVLDPLVAELRFAVDAAVPVLVGATRIDPPAAPVAAGDTLFELDVYPGIYAIGSADDGRVAIGHSTLTAAVGTPVSSDPQPAEGATARFFATPTAALLDELDVEVRAVFDDCLAGRVVPVRCGDLDPARMTDVAVLGPTTLAADGSGLVASAIITFTPGAGGEPRAVGLRFEGAFRLDAEGPVITSGVFI